MSFAPLTSVASGATRNAARAAIGNLAAFTIEPNLERFDIIYFRSRNLATPRFIETLLASSKAEARHSPGLPTGDGARRASDEGVIANQSSRAWLGGRLRDAVGRRRT
jgi:hypothetical protein